MTLSNQHNSTRDIEMLSEAYPIVILSFIELNVVMLNFLILLTLYNVCRKGRVPLAREY